MGWLGFGGGEKSSGDSGKVSNVEVNVKTDRSGRVKDVLVSESGRNAHKNHTHYYKKSSGSWSSSKKGKG